MEDINIDNKFLNLSNNIIYTNKYLLKRIIKTLKIININSLNNLSNKDKLKEYYKMISLIHFKELNLFCKNGYELPDIYKINEYVNKNAKSFDFSYNSLKINEFDFYEEKELFKTCYNNKLLIYILFLTNDNMYENLFKYHFSISRNELFNKILNSLNLTEIFNDNFIINKLMNINFLNNDLFLDFQNLFYYLIFDLNIKINKKVKLLNELFILLNNILYSIIYIMCLPLIFSFDLVFIKNHKKYIEFIVLILIGKYNNNQVIEYKRLSFELPIKIEKNNHLKIFYLYDLYEEELSSNCFNEWGYKASLKTIEY